MMWGRFFILAAVVAFLVPHAAAASSSHDDVVSVFLDIASNLPGIRESTEFILARSEASQLRDNASPAVLASCVSSAQNASLWDPNCENIFGTLQGFSSALGSSRSTVNNTVIDSVCRNRCFQKFNLFFRAWGRCLQQNGIGPSPSGPTTPINPRPRDAESDLEVVRKVTIARSFEKISPRSLEVEFGQGWDSLSSLLGGVMNMFCLKNEQGNYCMAELSQVSTALDSVSMSGSGSSGMGSMGSMPPPPPGGAPPAVPDIGAMCSSIQGTGCCLGAYATTIIELMTSSVSGPQAAQLSASMQESMSSIQQACGFNLPTSCTPSAASAAKLNGVARVSLTWSWWQSQTAQRQNQIKTAVCTDLAAAGGFYADLCSITGVSQASSSSRRLLQSNTAFDYTVLGVSSAALQSTSTSLAGSVNFQDVAQVAGVNSVSGSSTVSGIVPPPAPPANAGSVLSMSLAMVSILVSALLALSF